MQLPFKVSLSAHDIACERGGRTLFQGLSFTLAPGEALLVSGPNGAGKTSLLRQLAGLLPLAAGKAALTVRENLAFWAEFLGDGDSDLAGALAAFGLEPLADFPAGLLSAGQKRKLALSRLYAAPRPVWLLDEPSVSLDVHTVTRLDAAIRDHLKKGGIAIVSTHVPLKTAFDHELALGQERAA